MLTRILAKLVFMMFVSVAAVVFVGHVLIAVVMPGIGAALRVVGQLFGGKA